MAATHYMRVRRPTTTAIAYHSEGDEQNIHVTQREPLPAEASILVFPSRAPSDAALLRNALNVHDTATVECIFVFAADDGDCRHESELTWGHWTLR